MTSPIAGMSWSTILGAVVALVAGFYLLQGFILSRRDVQEPLYILPTVPLIGHLIDYLKKGTPYFSDVEYEVDKLPTLIAGPIADTQ